jgi:hypothetical protein
VIPVLVSILIIIVIAVVRTRSETLAAVTATMPVTIPLALWIVYSGASGDQGAVLRFIEALFITMLANLFFIGAIWLAARAGWRLVSLLIGGYVAWSVALALIMIARRVLRR